MTPLTGDDVAELHLVADAHQCNWVTVHGLPIPYWVDQERRLVHVDGRLDVNMFFEAIREGLGEITRRTGASNIVPFRHRHTG